MLVNLYFFAERADLGRMARFNETPTFALERDERGAQGNGSTYPLRRNKSLKGRALWI